ncbi:response regulator [Sphingoaurantiacus capsulatus]|uniref:Response regulator n=1 Tax=Sphingoaurantiacus capsulatus TaxID=1771310 RepID=A0ABV7X503_9SPHN
MADKIRILVVDDHPMLREGVVAIVSSEPDMHVVGEASSGLEGIELFRQLGPDVTLMDLQMPGMDGVEAIERLRAEAPNARFLVLTTFAGDTQALRALRAGAAGYLLKSGLRRELIDAIRAVHSGCRAVAPAVAQEIALHAAEEPLSDREVAVLIEVANGRANKEIARALSITEDTVKSHLKSIYAKLGVDDRAHAVTVANRRGIISI